MRRDAYIRATRTERDVNDLATTYFSYVSRRLLHAVRVRREDSIHPAFTIAGLTLLRFEARHASLGPSGSSISYRITGGLLARPNSPNGTLSIFLQVVPAGRTRFCLDVSEYHPRLAGRWGGVLYRFVQLPVHQWLGDGFVMWAAGHKWDFEEAKGDT